MPINKEYVPIDNQPTIKPRTVTGIFTRYIAKTLPLAFDESMSYYECLCALLEYINTKVIPALDNNAEGLLELQEFYEELQTYVNDYFKNLDVQEEINNKLDDMAESGELTDIIAQYLGLAGMITFDTVSDMKLAQNLVNGSKCCTLGYSTLNDGGKALYKIRTITNSDIVDESTIISLYNENLIAQLISTEINPEQFTGSSDTEKVQNAINYACSMYNENQKDVSIVLNRMFTINDKLYININVNRSVLTFKSNTSGGFNITTTAVFDTNETYVSDITFKNITFKSTENNNLIIMESPKFINIKFLNCNFKNVDTCVHADTYVQSFSWDNCTITGGRNNFIDLSACYYINFTNNIVEHRRDSYLLYQHSTEGIHNKLSLLNITNNLIEGFTYNSGILHIIDINEVNFINNYIEYMPTVIETVCVNYGGVLNINNNILLQNTQFTNSGLLKISPDSNELKFGNISFENNKINGTYAIVFNIETLPYTDASPKITYKNNNVYNTFTSTEKYNGLTTSPLFNKLPVYLLTDQTGDSIYSRKVIVDCDIPITWTYAIEKDTKTYNIQAKLHNGLYYLYNYFTQYTNMSVTQFNLYYGFDIYNDDDIILYSASYDSCLLNHLKAGEVNSKRIICQAITYANAGQRNYISKICLSGYQG